MDFSFRPTTSKDIQPCFPRLYDNFAFRTPKSREDLASFWRHVLAQKIAISAVTEDHRGSPAPRIVGVGMSLFVTDRFAQECKTTLPPYTCLQVVRRWKAQNRVFLTPPEVARHNAAAGLNVLILHYGVEKGASPERFNRINQKMAESFFLSHAGYNLKEFLYEVYGGAEKSRQMVNGFLLRRDYHEARRPQEWDSPDAPYMLGINRQEAMTPNANFGLALIFNYTPPRFGFSPAEKKLLQQGLAGQSDQEMAHSLKLSVWTVKKGWQRIYARVEKKDQGLIGLVRDEEKTGEEGFRAQRRRKLLEYVRGHMEELRPGPLPRRGPQPKSRAR
jgi:hypothetical protein